VRWRACALLVFGLPAPAHPQTPQAPQREDVPVAVPMVPGKPPPRPASPHRPPQQSMPTGMDQGRFSVEGRERLLRERQIEQQKKDRDARKKKAADKTG